MPSLRRLAGARRARWLAGDAPGAIEIDEEGAGEIFDALSSATARTILTTLYERPRTPSEVSDAVDTSVQNVHHHLDQLREAGLVEVTGTRFSRQGREMNVYGPTTEGLVLFAGDAGRRVRRPGPSDGDARLLAALALAAVAGIALWRYVTSR